MKILMFLGVGVVAAVVVSFLLSWPVMWLWNAALVGAVDGVREISWLQAWGIMILAYLLIQQKQSEVRKD